MGLNGIDISSWQDDLVVSNMGSCDFIIVKATGGAGYKNECFERHANDTLATGKLLGCYHYARDRGYEGSAEAEADHFINAFRPYIGKAIPFLDWEADALNLGVAWAKAWLDRVKAKTGVTPGIYTSKSVCFAYDWSSVAKTYPLWVAQYPNYEETGFLSEPWTDGWDFGAWDSPLIFQYTGTGRIPGYSGHLDLDLFYGSKVDWQRLCKAAGSKEEGETMAISRANVAAQIMEHLCTCSLHGYSQPGRHGTSGHCSVKTDAGTVKVTKGDRDCSSAVCEAWELALAGTPYDGLITRYNWTGGMREMFVGSGLFSWKPMSFNALRGDIYLDEQNHTAMCIRNDGSADLLGEFSISETGGIDGEPGDQTGRESWVHDYYSGSWDGILHYNGKADTGGAPGGSGSGAPSGDVSELAERVIAGEFGNGDARRQALGSRYDEVQAEVNRILSGGSSSGSYDVDALARRVIAGEFGNGDARRQALGSRYDAVQRRVNEILGAAGTARISVDVDAMARAVIRGDYGNGDERKRRLGSYYSIVQARVNEMLS
jgi:GH25 family lysozyme M1 (1,4-beta-N-acetylmuramidase)